jgi:glycosyltransferase involved in cell wall biosynthesis
MKPPILHVAPFLWSGAGSVITRLCEAQRTDGPVAIVTTGRHDGLRDWRAYRDRLRRAGVLHYSIDFFHRDPSTFWASADRLAALIDELRPEVIHAHAGVPSAGAVVARGRSRHRPRVIGQMYSWGVDRPEWMNLQDAWAFAQTDRVVCSARAYERQLAGLGVPGRKLTYLPWGLPLEELICRNGDAHADEREPRARSAAASRTNAARGPVLGFVGRIEPRKQQLELVEVLARVRRTHPYARLELVGPVADSSYADRIHDALITSRLAGAVKLTGRIRDVAARVRKWDLFVSLSTDEGQGLAVQEAMALGVPVVARPVAGLEDFLAEGHTAFTIDSPGRASAAAAIVRAWESPASRTRIARGARRLIERRYAWERMLPVFERLYWR